MIDDLKYYVQGISGLKMGFEMKNIIKMLIIIVVMSVFTVKASAKEPDDYIKDFESVLPDGFENIVSDEPESALGPEALLLEIRAILNKRYSSAAAFFLSLVGALAFMSLSSLCPEGMRETAVKGVAMISAVFIGGVLVKMFAEISESLSSASAFFSSLIPIMSAITLAGGGVKSAAIGAMGMNTVLSLVGGGFTAVLTALCGFSLAMSLAAAVGGEGAVSISRSSRGLFLWFFGIATALLMATLSLQTLVSGAADSAAMRTAKYMAQSSIPMVGGTISASLSTLAAGLSYAKGIIGGGAIFVLLLIFLSPLIMLLLYRLALSFALSLSELLGITPAFSCFSSFRGAVDIIIAVYGLSAVLYIFEIILFIKSGLAL